MKLFLLPGLFLAIQLTQLLADDNPRDGNWWRQQIQMARTVYVIGVMDGLNAVSGLESARMTKQDFAAHQQNINFLIGPARAGQIVEGLDIFYRDFRNRNILVADAFWNVTMEINGIPLTEEVVEKQRRKAAAR